MNRPAKKLAHLEEKVARKITISLKKPGRRTKRWKKWIAAAQKAVEALQGGAQA
jgi:ribosome maturation factor RimP